MTRRLRVVPALLLAVAVGACEGDLLDVQPVDEISDEIAIVDLESAEAALVGAYDGLQDGWYYGGDWMMWSETLTDNAEHTGTFESYADADLVFLRPDMGTIDGVWRAMYEGINRVNLLIQKVPGISEIEADDQDRILGQAYAVRALNYFNLVRSWGEVPLVLQPPANLEEAAQVTRASVANVYSQIEADLAEAESRLSGAPADDRTLVTPGFIDALQAKVALYQEDWTGAASAAADVMASGDYALVPFADLFTANGDPTSGDILRLVFTAVDFCWQGYYYQFSGRFEIGATQAAYDIFDPADARFAVTFGETRSDGIEVVKFPTPIGAEDIHVIRYADVILMRAEALAQQGGAQNLADAVMYMNMVRTRAGLTGYDLATDLGNDQQQVLDAIFLERRLELAYEGEYWFDLVRTGRAAAAIGSNFDSHEAVWPIPQGELDTAPNLTQNPGY